MITIDDYYQLLGVSKNATFYQILRVPTDATSKEIELKYKQLMFKYHPDRSKEHGAEEIAKILNEIRETLLDPQKRKKYDREMEEKRKIKERQAQIRKRWEEAQERKLREEAENKTIIRSHSQKLIMGVILFLALFGALTLINWNQVTQRDFQNLPSASATALCANVTNNVGNIVSIINTSINTYYSQNDIRRQPCRS